MDNEKSSSQKAKHAICYDCDMAIIILFSDIECIKLSLYNSNHMFNEIIPLYTQTLQDRYIECERQVLRTICYVKILGIFTISGEESGDWLKNMLKAFRLLKIYLQNLKNDIILNSYVMFIILAHETTNNINFQRIYAGVISDAMDILANELRINDNSYINNYSKAHKYNKGHNTNTYSKGDNTNKYSKLHCLLPEKKSTTVNLDSDWHRIWFPILVAKYHKYIEQNNKVFIVKEKCSQGTLLENISTFFNYQLKILNNTYGADLVGEKVYRVLVEFANICKYPEAANKCQIKLW